MNRLRLVPLGFAMNLGLVACGGSDDGRPSGEPESTEALDPCTADEGYEFQDVVNFEPREVGDPARLSYTAFCEATTPCTFYFNYDEAQSPPNPEADRMRGPECLEEVNPGALAFSDPVIEMSQVTGQPIEGGRCDTDTAGLRVIAKNVGMCYGPDGRLGWGAALDLNFTPVLDATEWDGIALWVRNSSAARIALNLSLADRYTSGAENPDTGEPYCKSMDPPAGQPPWRDSEKCDAFGVAVTLTDEWSFVPVRFASMRQKGFGVPSEHGLLDTETISRMQILMSAGTWDFWIDDVALFRTEQ
jgi:hypothetical protein